MILRVDGRRYAGRAVSVHGVDPRRVVRAVRRDGSKGPATAADGDRPGTSTNGDGSASGSNPGPAPSVAVVASDPGPAYEYVGLVTDGEPLSLRAALAAAARTLGYEAPQDEEIAALEERLAEPSAEEIDRREARRRVAEAATEERRLDERVAELRGRVRARRERGGDAEEAADRLEAAVADLTEARTERIAAEQRLDDLDDRVRAVRDRRERRLRTVDRRDNLRRAARQDLARRLWPAFRAALQVVPGEGAAGETPGSVRGDDRTARLAVARVADVDAPVVLDGTRFTDAASAARCLDAPVIRATGSHRDRRPEGDPHRPTRRPSPRR